MPQHPEPHIRRAVRVLAIVGELHSRQEDLITYLLAILPQQERAKIVAELQIDLSPTNRKRWLLEDGQHTCLANASTKTSTPRPPGSPCGSTPQWATNFPSTSIICIGALIVHQEDGRWTVDALGAPHIGERSEKELISSFVDRMDKLSPQLVTFNWIVV